MDETQTPVDTTQQGTSKVPTTHVKNPNRVKAVKAIAERRRRAQQAQKQKNAEADVIVANEQLRKAKEEVKKVDESPPETALPDTAPPDKETVSQTLTTTQWLSVISIFISLVGVYYKREEIKNALSKIKAPASNTQTTHASATAQTAPAQTAPAQTAPAQTAPAQTAPASPPVNKTPKKVGIQTMA